MRSQQSGFVEAMVADMLRYIGMLRDAYGLAADPEIGRLRQFYLASGGMTDVQKFTLLSEWKASLLARCLKQGKGGAGNAAGSH